MTAQWQVTEEAKQASGSSATVTTTTVTQQDVIDWDAAPTYEAPAEETAPPAYQPRGRWDFTDGQRIVLSLLIWLNIIVFVVGVQVVTGRLMV